MKASDLSVLFIEDDESFVQLGKMILEEEGIKKNIALNEEQAIEYSRKNDYNLIICDTMNSCVELSGPRIIKKIREMGRDPVVVALSCDENNKKYWDKFKKVYFFRKGDFWSKYFPQFLKEKFEI